MRGKNPKSDPKINFVVVHPNSIETVKHRYTTTNLPQSNGIKIISVFRWLNGILTFYCLLEIWANAQCDDRPAKHRGRPLFNAARFGSRPLLDAVQ